MKPTLLMIHGAFAGGWSFDSLRAYFEARGYRCLTPNLRHHGAGRHPNVHPALATTGMRDYLADLTELVDGLAEPPIVVGHSLGGLLAQMLAAARPLKATILLAPSAPWGVLASSLLEFMGANSLFLNGAPWETALLPVYQVAAEYTFDRLSMAERHEIFSKLGPEAGRASFEVLHWPLDAHRATFVFPRDVNCPLLTLVGTRDRVNPPETVRRVAKRYRGRSDFLTLDGMSHWLVTEPGWDDMAQIMADWIETV
jgi:pimeloyl-ACP methyl ester carboxylesterase